MIKKLVLALTLILVLNCTGLAQGDPDYIKTYRFTTSGVNTDSVADVSGLGIGFWKVVTQVKGTPNPGACTAVLQGAPVNVNASYGTIVSTSCVTASGGQTIPTANPNAWIRVNMSSFTAGVVNQEVAVTIMGWREITGLTISNPLIVQSIPYTPAGATSSTTAFTATLGSTVFAVSASASKYLDGISVFNGHSAVCFIQFFDLATGSVTLGTTTPAFSIGVPTLQTVNIFNFLPLKLFNTAISVASTTTNNGSTTCTTASTFTAFYH
jgi:hypothetical protein